MNMYKYEYQIIKKCILQLTGNSVDSPERS